MMVWHEIYKLRLVFSPEARKRYITTYPVPEWGFHLLTVLFAEGAWTEPSILLVHLIRQQYLEDIETHWPQVFREGILQKVEAISDINWINKYEAHHIGSQRFITKESPHCCTVDLILLVIYNASGSSNYTLAMSVINSSKGNALVSVSSHTHLINLI